MPSFPFPIPTGTPAPLILASSPCGLCFYCIRCHRAKVRFGGRTYSFGPEDLHDFLRRLERELAWGGRSAFRFTLLADACSPDEARELMALLRRARSALMAIFLRPRTGHRGRHGMVLA